MKHRKKGVKEWSCVKNEKRHQLVGGASDGVGGERLSTLLKVQSPQLTQDLVLKHNITQQDVNM